MTLGHNDIVRALEETSRENFSPIEPGSLKFKYKPAASVSESGSLSATATEVRCTARTLQLPVEIRLQEFELLPMLQKISRRIAGRYSKDIEVWHEEKAAYVLFRFILPDSTTGQLRLEGSDLNQALARELRSIGYEVDPETGISWLSVPFEPGTHNGARKPYSVYALVQTRLLPFC